MPNMSDHPLTIKHSGEIVPFTTQAVQSLSEIDRALQASMVKAIRDDLEHTVCFRCRLNVFNCACTTEQMHEYFDRTTMKVRYAR